MKQVTLIFIVLLMAIAFVYADGGSSAEQAEHWEKVRQLDQLAEGFKAETGFTGRILTSTERMLLYYYEGRFADIQITAEADTASFRAAFERILDKVLPYTYANREQLTRSRITNNLGRIKTEYYQQINGYRVEGAGRLSIVYETGRNGFAIGNGTVELPEEVTINISLAQAIENAKEVYNSDYKFDKSVKFSDPKTELLYTRNPKNPADTSYSLNYKISYWGLAIYIDPSNGNLSYTRSFLIEDFHSHADGFLYKSNYTSTTIDTLGYQGLYKVTFEQQNMGYGYEYRTDLDGDVLVTVTDMDSLNVMLKNECLYRLCEYPDTLRAVVADTVYVIQDSLKAIFKDNAACSVNVYHHITNQYYALMELHDNHITGYKIITNMPNNSPYNGICDPNYMAIRLVTKAGKFSHVARHEMSHAFIYSLLNDHFLNASNSGDTHGCMDEALAVYLPCSVLNSQYYIPSINSSWALNNIIHIDTQYQNVNEETYSYYWSRYPLASAWWGLRNRTHFPDLDDNDFNAVDTLLVNTLAQVGEAIPENNAYRYKPRYFYNILMSRVDTDNSSWPLNDKQAAIDSAYSERGFHFYPTVISAVSDSVNNPVGKQTYNVLDSVFVHIKNCPQNTKVEILIIPHQSYAHVGSGGVPIPAAYNANGNPVSREVRTNSNGVWAGGIPYSNQLPQGDYDIIVNIGSDCDKPDDKLNLVFAKDNVIDAVDGLNGPGFIKTGFGDMVVALDLSSSMQDYGNHLAQTVKVLKQSMIPSERINVFGFTEGTENQNWIEDGIKDLIGTDSSFYEAAQIDSNYINTIMSSVLIEGNTDLVLPFHHGRNRLNNLVNPGDKKSIILISDGIHFVTPPHEDYPGYEGNCTHTIAYIDSLIQMAVVPDSIRCYTICYGLSPEGISNMKLFALWGNGTFYSAPSINDLRLYINQLLCNIRGTAAIVNSIKSIEPGTVQSHEIMVEPQASEFRVIMTGQTDLSGAGISHTLISPSGVVYKQADNAAEDPGTYKIRNPESGLWTAQATNNSTAATSYSIVGDTVSDINLRVTPLPVSHPIDKPLLVCATIKDYCTPISGASVMVKLSRDDWSTELALYDDGNHNDEAADDGVYANFLCPYAESFAEDFDPESVYKLEVMADMPSVQASREYVQQIYIESNSPYTYPINSRLLTRGWNWKGFPRLSEYEGGNSVPLATISLNPYLTHIVCGTGSAAYDGSGWSFNGLTQLDPQSGYKLQISNTDQATMYDVGAITDTTSAYVLIQDEWNWVTYPCFSSAYPEDVLASVIDNVDYIMAQNWSMKKEDGVWTKQLIKH